MDRTPPSPAQNNRRIRYENAFHFDEFEDSLNEGVIDTILESETPDYKTLFRLIKTRSIRQDKLLDLISLTDYERVLIEIINSYPYNVELISQLIEKILVEDWDEAFNYLFRNNEINPYFYRINRRLLTFIARGQYPIRCFVIFYPRINQPEDFVDAVRKFKPHNEQELLKRKMIFSILS